MKFPSSEPQDLLTEHLLNHPHALGFVGVGIGKTSATLAALSRLLKSGDSKGALVIAPMRVANLTWPMEVQRWDDFNWMRVANLRTEAGKRAFLQGKAHIYVVNFESIPILIKLLKGRKDVGSESPYDTVVIDECFAPGTLIDTPEGKKPIDQVKKGDCVNNAVGVGTVTHAHRNRIREAVLLTIDGKRIWCSSNHKFFTESGWVEAKALTRETKIVSTGQSMRIVRCHLQAKRSLQRAQNEILFKTMLDEARSQYTCMARAKNDRLPKVRGKFQSLQKEALLLDQLLREVDSRAYQKKTHSRNEEENVRVNEEVFCRKQRVGYQSKAKNRGFEPYGEPRECSKIERKTKRNRAQAASTRGQWEADGCAPTSLVQFPVRDRAGDVVFGESAENKRYEMRRVYAEPLQVGYSLRKKEAVHRSGRLHSQLAFGEIPGCEETAGPGIGRVESVEVLQPCDPRLDGFRDADGHVYFYDLSVSGHPSYSVNGLLVHNCTKIKNPSSKRINAYRREVPHEKHKRIWALTGTPAPNTLMDLFAQVRFVDGGKRLGRAFDLFKQTYFRPTGYQGYQWKELPGSQEKIEERIADITLTLRSKDWLNLPDTVVEDVEVPLPADLANRYREFERELVLEIRKDKDITAANAAALVSKLLQFTSGSVYDEEGKYHELHDLKLKALERIAREADSPLLVAVAFKHELARIRERFPKAKFFQDAKGLKAQKDMLEEWNAGKIPMLVAHPKSMSHGLNLQAGGNNLVWMSLTYSRDDYEQTIGRLERRGQDAVVKVWRIVCPDTVDYAVATVVEEKRATEDRLLTALQLLESCRDSGRKIEFVEEESWI